MIHDPKVAISSLLELWNLPATVASQLLEIHASCLEKEGQNSFDEQTRATRKAFDVLAEAMLDAGRLTERTLIDEVPLMAFDVSHACKWIPFTPKNHPRAVLQNFFRPLIIRWRMRLLHLIPQAPRRRITSQKARAEERSAWLNRENVRREWTDNDIARHGGPDRKTIKAYREGKVTSRTSYVREKIAKAFGYLNAEIAPE